MMQTIRKGDTGQDVFVARCLLAMDELSDVFDEPMETVVKDFQTVHKLTADGIIGKSTLEELANTAPTVSTTKNKYGCYASAVQSLLNSPEVKVDGIYGTKTKAAVKAYQTRQKLSADGIVGKQTWRSFILGEVPQGKVINDCVYYCQWDSKWSKVMYSSTGNKKQTIGNSGCGPTSMAMILATWINPEITPVQTCADAQKNGYRTKDKGTSWSYFNHVFKTTEGFKKFLPTGSMATLKAALREGALAVCSMNSNDNNFWTKGGHFIVAVGCDDEYIYANDPNKLAHPRKQKQDKFKTCMKQAFIFWR